MFEHAAPSTSSLSFLWLTDFHFDKFYGTRLAVSYGNELSCLFPNASHLGTRGCDSPEALIDSALFEAWRLVPDAPFILLTGDFMRHDDDNHTQKLEVLHEVVSKVRKWFPNSLLLPSIGNNDLWGHWEMNVSTQLPWSPIPTASNTNLWLSEVAEHWALMNTWPCVNAWNTFSYGGYYSCDIDKVNLTFIQLNSIPYNPKHIPITDDMDDPFGQLAWLDQTLSSLEKRNRKVFITGHVPWGVDAYGTNPYALWEEKYTFEFLALIAKYEDIIRGQLFGHTHINNVRLPPKNYNISSPLFVAASVSPIYHNYPAVRVMNISTENLCVTGFDDYYLNISDPNVSTMNWKKLGDMQNEYRLPGNECFSVDFARSEFQYMWYNNTKDWTNYLTFWAAGAGKQEYEDNTIYCSMMWVTKGEFDQCITRQLMVTNKGMRSYIIFSIIIACSVFFVLFIWLFYKICWGDGAKDLLKEPLNPRKGRNIYTDEKTLGFDRIKVEGNESPEIFEMKNYTIGSLGIDI